MNLRRNILSGSDGALASRSNFLFDLLCSTRLINRISACNRQNKQLTNLYEHVHCPDLHKMGQACNSTYETQNCIDLQEARKSTNYYGTLALKSESVSPKI